eukprot:m.510938 g.510938  ORF g.510938 m.510938 type:complete len:103 (-) comp57423_c1_seq3:1721-2029(-)
MVNLTMSSFDKTGAFIMHIEARGGAYVDKSACFGVGAAACAGLVKGELTAGLAYQLRSVSWNLAQTLSIPPLPTTHTHTDSLHARKLSHILSLSSSSFFLLS